MILESKKILDQFEILKIRYEEIKSAFNYNSLIKGLEDLKALTLDENFWSKKEEAQNILKRF